MIKKIGERSMTNKMGRTWSGQFRVMLYDFKVYFKIDLQYINEQLKLESSYPFLIKKMLNES